MRRNVALLLLLAVPASAAPSNEAAVVAFVEGTVTLRGGTPVVAGDRLAVPFDLDASGGTASLVWEESGSRLLVERFPVRLLRADTRGARVVVGDVRVDLPRGQGLHARHQAEKTPKVFLRAPDENTGAVSLASCQTLVRLLPSSSVSVLLDREGMTVVVQGEAGVVEVQGRERSHQVLAGQRLIDGCVPPPGETSVEPPETRSALTPFTP